MKSQSKGGRPPSGNASSRHGRQDVEAEYGDDGRTQKSAASSSDTGSFGANRGDAQIDSDLEDIEQEDDSLLAGGREDVESYSSQPSGRSSGSSAGKSGHSSSRDDDEE
jgi:hypothetical protein